MAAIPPGRWFQVICGLTACTPGSALGRTLSNEYGITLPFFYLFTFLGSNTQHLQRKFGQIKKIKNDGSVFGLMIWRPKGLIWFYQWGPIRWVILVNVYTNTFRRVHARIPATWAVSWIPTVGRTWIKKERSLPVGCGGRQAGGPVDRQVRAADTSRGCGRTARLLCTAPPGCRAGWGWERRPARAR